MVFSGARAMNKIPKEHKITNKVANACKPKKPKSKERICLRCDAKFLSVGGLRLCPECQPARSSRANVARHHRFHGSQSDMFDDD